MISTLKSMEVDLTAEQETRFIEAVRLGEADFDVESTSRTIKWGSVLSGCSTPDGGSLVAARGR